MNNWFMDGCRLLKPCEKPNFLFFEKFLTLAIPIIGLVS